MSEYLLVAETIFSKNNKLSCINVYDNFSAVALPAEFVFDMAVICGPNWTPGEHKISIKAKTNTEATVDIGNIDVNIPNENFVYNAIAQNLRVTADYGIQSLTFIVLDGEEKIIERTYPIRSLLVPAPKKPEAEEPNNENKEENQQ